MPEIMDDLKDLWFSEENFNGVLDEFLNEDNFFDFPIEDLEASGQVEDWNSLLLPSMDSTSLSSCCGRRVDSLKPSKYKFPKDEDTYEQALVSAKVKPSDVKPSKPPRTSSPISVLESGNSYSIESAKINSKQSFSSLGNLSAEAKRARSKRTRPEKMVNSSSWLTTNIISTIAPFESDMVQLNKRKEKKKRKNLSQLSNSTSMYKEWLEDTGRGKKCSHCEVTKTPQWREGPLGPKSLCNACGVRYRSGRLFPEYRPAASPTFVPSLHSNSHRKVTEMRNRATRVGNDEVLHNKSIFSWS